MYERNAIVLERYFDKLFGYDQKSNLRSNYLNYQQLIEKIEKYQEAVNEEDKIILEYDQIINKIKETQKNQDILFKKNTRLQENRKNIFENIDENVDNLRKKLEKIEEEIQYNDEEMKQNGKDYTEDLEDFNNKSLNRNQCSKNRRIIERDYQKQLKETVTNINNINPQKVDEVKNFFKVENNNLQEEIQQQVIQNGAKEKISFDLRVIEKAIDLQTDIQEQETEILCSIYDKTHKLLVEIKNDTIKLDKHKKLIKDSESKLSFLNAMKEYLTLFLDNERLNIVGGEKEHRKLMNDACNNLDKDFVQIKNLYTLLVKEIIGRTTKKMYKDLYNPQYLYDLEEQEKEFENNISKLNVLGTVIYPDYWRIEGMQKIFTAFRNGVEGTYCRDLSEYEPVTSSYRDNIERRVKEEILSEIEEDIDSEDKENDNIVDDEIIKTTDNIKKENDKEIDKILGFYNFESDIVHNIDNEENKEKSMNQDQEKNHNEIEDIIDEQEEYNNYDDEEDFYDEEDEDEEEDFGDDNGYDDINFDEDDEYEDERMIKK